MKPKKTTEVLIVSGKGIIESLTAFGFDDLRHCPNDKPIDFRTRQDYDEDEKRVLELIPNVGNAIERYCPTVCSGLRGVGTRFRDGCRDFIGYGRKNDNVFDFDNPQSYVNCERYGKIEIEKFARDCDIRRLAVAVARSRKLIEHFGSGTLEYVSRKVCLKCDYYNEELDNCNFKVGCKKGEGLVFMFTDCTYGNCESCPERVAK